MITSKILAKGGNNWLSRLLGEEISPKWGMSSDYLKIEDKSRNVYKNFDFKIWLKLM